jgi:uracil-DNA glycosylase family 4
MEPTAPVSESVHEKMEDLRARALQCTRCGLSLTRTQVVFGDGNPETPMVIVGEGPGDNEDRQGKPFVGRAGKLLDECLLECGITRSHVWITNVIKCRACLEEDSRLSNRPPRAEEIASCKPIIAEEILIIRPLVVVCLGGPAANLIIHKGFRMTKERGVWFDDTPYAPYAMAALHPAYVLRQFGGDSEDTKRQLVEDIAKARDKVRELKSALLQGEFFDPREARSNDEALNGILSSTNQPSDLSEDGSGKDQMSLF